MKRPFESEWIGETTVGVGEVRSGWSGTRGDGCESRIPRIRLRSLQDASITAVGEMHSPDREGRNRLVRDGRSDVDNGPGRRHQNPDMLQHR